jgi:hypothetical protein
MNDAIDSKLESRVRRIACIQLLSGYSSARASL